MLAIFIRRAEENITRIAVTSIDSLAGLIRNTPTVLP
jgi:hypothetical protein